jgi:TPR repeat protein
VPPATDSAAALARRCASGDGLACGLAHEFARGEGGDDRASLEKGCAAGSPFTCASLSGSLDHATPPDSTRALAVARKACEGHSALGCTNAAQILSRDGEKNVAEVQAYADRTCGYGGDRDGVCRLSALSNLAPAAYLAGQEKGCAGGAAAACRLLGWSHETGYGTAVSVRKARDAYGLGCKAGDLWACFRGALFTADHAAQQQALEATCAKGSGPACYALSLPAYGLPAERRASLARAACEASVFEGCLATAVELAR